MRRSSLLTWFLEHERERRGVIEALIGRSPANGSVEDKLGVMHRVSRLVRPGEPVLMPEGALSGYDEDLSFLSTVDPAYPERWRHLADSGAGIFVYVTNAAGDAS